MRRWMCTTSVVAFALTAASAVFASQYADVPAAKRYLEQVAPTVRFYQEGPRITRVFGVPMAYGQSARDAAEQFRLSFSEVFGVPADDLLPEGPNGNPDNLQPVMYQADTGSYKFTLVSYAQYHDGVPVFRSDMRVLVRNDADYPVVSAASSLHDLGDFSLTNRAMAFVAPEQVAPKFERYTAVEPVIYAGVNNENLPAVLAVSFIAERGSKADSSYEKWLYVADASTGEILYREDQILHVDVTGNVSGNATANFHAQPCDSMVATGLPYARVSIGTTVAFADANGDFVIPNSGSGSVTVNAEVRGQWFNVNNQSGADASQSQTVTPPGPANFLFASGGAEQRRAEVDAYIHANTVRDFALAANPSYPTIGTQTDWPVNVNINDVCNAFYDGASINFFLSGGGCNNTAFGDVVHHEYGHHLVDRAGSGQGQYGEGTGDTVGMLITGQHELGIGFQSCSAGIRDAVNTLQYPCSGEIHFCGQVLSGCVWDTWQELKITDPANADTIIRDLAINAILMHTGDLITPAITNDYLVLDDDDGDLNNGTPHETEILTGFGNHNMVPQPPPANDDIANAIVACPGTYSGATTFATVDGDSSCASSSGSPDVWYSYTPDSAGTLTASLCDAGTDYDAAISIHSGMPANVGNELACDDDGCGTTGGPATASTAVSPGTTYYIRVTGWNGSAGNFVLNLSGPPCAMTAPLTISFPSGVPTAVAPGVDTTFDVQIDAGTENYQSGTGMLFYRYDGGTYLTNPLTELGGNQFQATLPGGNCGQTAEFYISAQGDLGSTVTSPSDAPTTVYSAAVGNEVVIINDNFETDMGWTVANLGATTGDWERGVPVNDPGWAYDPTSDGDGSGQCYLTQNQAGNTDIDGGEVQLISPTIDMTSGNIAISYMYYLYLTDTSGTDWIKVGISSNGDAGPWTNLATHLTNGSLSWRTNTITQADLDAAGVALTANMKLRFRARDADPQSIVEAGIDAFRVTSFTCDSGQPCPGDTNGDGQVDITDVGNVLSDFGLTGPGLPGDVDGDNDVDVADLGTVLAAFGAPCP